MSGNDTYMTMLQNKLKISDFKINDEILESLYEPLDFTEGLVYYDMTNTYGSGTLEVLFENALDMENYRVNLTTTLGINKIIK
jgi:hypothetical protein